MWFLDVVTRVLGTSTVLVSCGFDFDFLTLFSAHAGYLHLVSACFKCCCNSSGLKQMV